MLSNLVILLDDRSFSYCCFPTRDNDRRLISLDHLRSGIMFAFKENLSVQVVYPDYTIPIEYEVLLSGIDHTKVTINPGAVQLINWDNCESVSKNSIVIIQTDHLSFFSNYLRIPSILNKCQKCNVFFTDIERFSDVEFKQYQSCLDDLSEQLILLYRDGLTPQLNLVTDLLYLKQMNNCGAGVSNITLAPDGCFYICAAFYHEHLGSVGDLNSGVNILNGHLFSLKHAPICRKCDAFHCRRCVWLNYKTTQEVNTPSHEQCVISHIEREASRRLLSRLNDEGILLFKDRTINPIHYSDPFELIKKI